MTGNLVETTNLVKRYHGKTVVEDVNVRVGAGEIVGLLGPNGAGKTTTFYMIVGLIRPDGGKIKFKGKDIAGRPMYKRARMGLGYLPQEPSVFRKLSVEDNVMAILETLDISRDERKQRLEKLLGDLGLKEVRRQKAFTLSGGERRKLEITRALVTNPALIMLDEPFSGVDPLAVDEIQKIVIGLRDLGLGILITDHNVRETLAVVDRAYLLYEGKVLREGKSSFLINDKVSRELYLGQKFKM
ncbi:MAG: LPS export ABC transporter ATP-binding protein [Verrucomicrobiota bacterium]